jgi:lambda family phage portal protein
MTITADTDRRTLDFLAVLEESHGRAADPEQSTPGRRTARDRFFDQRRRAREANFYASGFGFPTDQLTGGHNGGFNAARTTRLTDGWQPGQIGPNRLTQMGGKFMRARARDLVQNNPHAFSAVMKFINNVVGCGIHPKPQFDERGSRRLWVGHWDKWCGHTAHATRDCDVTRDQPFRELTGLWLLEMITAGGSLAYYRELPRRNRSIPLAIELIPEERFAEHITSVPGRNQKTANRIHQAIEYDPATGAKVAYWVTPQIPNDVSPQDVEPIRIPAEQAEYGYYKRMAGQHRGWTLLASAIQWLYALGYYTDSELYAADAKASWAYMITTGDGADMEWNTLADSSPASGTVDIHGNTIEKIEPGMVFRGFSGDEISAIGPNVPGSDSVPWLELIQRSIAIGILTSYEEMTGDYSNGNMASIRLGAESVRKGYRIMHAHCVDHWCNPAYRRFAEHSTREGVDGFPLPASFIADLDEWLRVKWSKPSWASPNPVHDATAQKIRKEQGLASDRDLVEEMGGDVDELYDELEQERDEKERRGLIPAGGIDADDDEVLLDEEEND